MATKNRANGHRSGNGTLDVSRPLPDSRKDFVTGSRREQWAYSRRSDFTFTEVAASRCAGGRTLAMPCTARVAAPS